MNALFGEVFEDSESYIAAPPPDAYADELLGDPTLILLIAREDKATVGALAAYQLRKFERQRSELYIYDLAVAETHRRRGIATALIQHLRDHARSIGAWVVYVQADPIDAPAVALYEKLGVREEVLHFDIAP